METKKEIREFLASRRARITPEQAGLTKHFNHPDVGELHLSYNRLDLAADPGLTLFTYTAEPGSRSEEALKLLGSLAATVDQAASARTTDHS